MAPEPALIIEGRDLDLHIPIKYRIRLSAAYIRDTKVTFIVKSGKTCLHERKKFPIDQSHFLSTKMTGKTSIIDQGVWRGAILGLWRGQNWNTLGSES